MALGRVVFVLKKTFQTVRTIKRNILSDAYQCQETWDKRLSTPILRDIDMDEYFTRLERKFNNNKFVDGVDIDIFANNVRKEDQLDELEHFIYRFRRSQNTIRILDSTHHAVIRAFMQFHKMDDLLKILSDRINYGIFPDFYCYNMLMDYFIRRKNYRDAAKVAVLVMLQEDFGHSITDRLVLYSCHSYLREPLPEPWTLTPVSPSKEETEEEETFVRIPFLINPYFDNHFDLQDPQLLLGKTLSVVGKHLGGPVGRTYQLIGLGMHREWEKVSQFLDYLASQGDFLIAEGLEIFRKTTNDFFQETEPARQGKFDRSLSQLEVKDYKLHDLVLDLVEEMHNFEANDIAAQKRQLDLWEEQRQKALDLQLQKHLQAEKIEFIEKRKRELVKREKLLFFFENRNEIEMELEEIEKMPKAIEKIEDYVPPEV